MPSTLPTRLLRRARVYGEGISQNGRFLRDFLYQGFNADEEGRIALDGVLAHVAGAGRGSFNYRFAQPSRDAQPTSSVFFPTDIFPFTDLPETDPVTGETGGLLDRALPTKLCRRFSSPTHRTNIGVAPRVDPRQRRWQAGRASPTMSASITSPDCNIFPDRSPGKRKGDLLGQQPQSPLPFKYFWRVDDRQYGRLGAQRHAATASSYPKIADGTLVPLSEFAFPTIPV